MDRKIILQDAILRLQGKSPNSNKTTIFSVIQNLLNTKGVSDSKGKDNLYYARTILNQVLNLKKGNSYRFMGVKLIELQSMICKLYCDEKVTLSSEFFGRYTHEDLLRYTEICRRICNSEFKADVIYKQNQNGFDIGIEEDSWSFDGMNICKILTAIENGNKDCAQYVIKNAAGCRDHALLKKAQKLLMP